MTDKTPKRTRKPNPAAWKPGQSGNPRGRPKGSGLSGDLRRAIQNRASELIDAMMQKALDGDVQAARTLLDRVLPALKAEAAPVTLPGIATPDATLAQRAVAALEGVARGDLSPDVGASLVAAVGALARVVEVDELERRIAALENDR